MKRIARWKTAGGFTLMEVIVTLLIVAVVGAMMFAVMGTSMTKSSIPISRLQTAFSCQQVMENFVADYGKNYPGDLSGLKAAIGAEGSGQENAYGKYFVVKNDFIKFVVNPSGGYQEQTTGTPTDNLLKVTIRNSNNETLTNIFVQ